MTYILNIKRGLTAIMVTIAYIRPDKHFDAAGEQLQIINSYAIANNMTIDEEVIDHISQNKRLDERFHVTENFQSQEGSTLLVQDVWVLSSNMEDVTEMFSCLLKNNFHVHFIKQSVIISRDSTSMLIFALIDQLRQTLKAKEKKVIGRPKGSKSSSKFDQYISDIIGFIREKKSVSEMARRLEVSRSSLKDYIESRELKQVAFASLLPEVREQSQEELINSIICPNETGANI
ncbi:recombinase family protein [Sulfurimonas sp.]|uniref:recombinase family protein n=1 Tax=Sulfurimonas sp. TaxID=2022749 RepID=UPI0039E4FA41